MNITTWRGVLKDLHSRQRLDHQEVEGRHQKVMDKMESQSEIFKHIRSGINGCFRKWWYPQIIHFNRDFRRNNSLQNVPNMYSYDPWYEDACNLLKLCEGMARIGAVMASSIITQYRVFWNGWSEIARHVINHQMC